jgi:hypothetical protein
MWYQLVILLFINPPDLENLIISTSRIIPGQRQLQHSRRSRARQSAHKRPKPLTLERLLLALPRCMGNVSEECGIVNRIVDQGPGNDAGTVKTSD